MHFLTVVLLPKDTSDIEEAINSLLISHLDVIGSEGPRRKEYIDPEEVRFRANQCWVRLTDLEKVAAKVHEKFKTNWQVDEGGIFHMTSLIVNPNWKLDRWQKIDICRFPGLESNAWPVVSMPRNFLPLAIVTPDGVWHEEEPEPPKWWKTLLLGPRLGWELTEKEKQAIRQWAYSLIDRYPDHLAVALDCHR